jgi:GAF domain-containing protein/nitrogen-specific signal transduction histidine kinase
MAAKGKRALACGRRTVAEVEAELEKRTAELQELAAERDAGLARENAVAEVLQVINSSPGDLAPVFEAMLEKAVRLCEADTGHLFRFENGAFFRLASHGLAEDFDKLFPPDRPVPLNPSSIPARMIATRSVVHVRDQREDESYRLRLDRDVVAAVEAGILTVLFVPLLKEGEVVGHFTMHRMKMKPFSDRQIALLQNFAAQAVIAIENARLITEMREALDQQTATAEVLGVINSSPGDLVPVWDTMLEKAASLCGANLGLLCSYDGEAQILLASRGMSANGISPELMEMARRVPIEPGSSVGRLARGKDEYIHTADITDDDAYRSAVPSRRLFAELTGARTALWVALRKEEALIGVFILYRTEIRPFTDKQIALLRNFAQQAVIAMENARLLTETREALEKQTATAEILRVISSSPTDVQPTFEAIAERATVLTGADSGGVFRFDGELIHFAAHSHWTPEELAAVDRHFPRPPGSGSVTAQAILTGEVAHIADVATEADYQLTALTQVGLHTALSVPILRQGSPVGAITVTRHVAEPFSEAQIDLLKTFADQAVIAIENVRLFDELNERTDDLEESLEYQTATSDVLKVISRSTFDLQPVLDTLLQTAARLCSSDSGGVTVREGDAFRYAGMYGISDELADVLGQRPLVPSRDTVAGRTVLEAQVVHLADIAADPSYNWGEVAASQEIRTVIGVPLVRGTEVIGTFSLARNHVEPFTERQIELVRTFADQAAIAIENTRLITETQEALEQQQAIAEVLAVINANPGNLQPVFDAMLAKAMQLCGAAFGGLVLWRDEGWQMAARSENVLEPFREFLETSNFSPGPRAGLARVAQGEGYIHIIDITASKFYQAGDPTLRAMADLGGGRTMLTVPLAKDDEVPGFFSLYRDEVKAFSDRQIALVKSFAAQAVIAMDNARLLEEIRQRQAELRVTFDNMGDGVAMFDAEHRLAAWNRNFQQILDLPDEFVAPRPTLEEYIRYLAQHGEYGDADVEGEVRRVVSAVAGQISAERTRPDGRIIELRNDPVPDGGFVLMYRDITERKRAEAEIHAARDAAEGALRELKLAQANLIQAEKMASLGQLTAGIAHEIKNPLNFVNNFAALSNELLGEFRELAEPALATLDAGKREEADETIEMLSGNLDKIVEHGRRADNIVKSMLAHSRGSSGDRQEVDLNALVEESLNLAYHGARAQDQSFNIALERDFDHTLKPIELVPQDMTRVFLNLFGNGFYAANKRAHADGDAAYRPVLHVATREAGDAVEVKVRDNGTGIPATIRDKLFQPFFTTKPTGDGTGLGLSISYDIVTQEHGGMIAVDSEEGSFTEFTIRLPRGGAAAANGARA